ncbi:MAG TPA: branched-chain amino acid ABC transporter permease [Burkholderiales bacterium]|jgi:branched-chain amino acid transport system permease protein|nr:branched-chain amino acid ABC transporter permease [Burkholderiales bacterium]
MNQLLAVLIDGLIYSSWLFIIAVGLTLIYGVMKILNIAHGSLYALGAYGAASLAGYWINQGHAPMGSFAVMLVAAILVGLIAGPVIERGLLRFMYGKDEIVLVLVTYAVFLILEDFIKLTWGVDPYLLYQPYSLLGSFDVGDLTYPLYNLVLFGVAVLIGVTLAWVLTRTRRGKMLVAVIHDREMAGAMGINVSLVYFVTFTVGAMLGAVGGALTAPMISVQPGIGAETIVLAFAVVVIGGLGSLPGAALAAVLVGLVRSAAVHYRPELDLFAIYFVMAVVLIMRPKGLFSVQEARKI